MKRRTKVIAFGTVTAVLVGGLAFAAQGYKEHRAMHKMFSPKAIMKQIDQNGDLSISLEELTSAVEKQFVPADANSDGSVSKMEIVAAIEGFEEHPRLKRHSGKIADRIANGTDINQDGKIEKGELENRLRKFHALADWNDDGQVEAAEIKRLRSGFGRGWRKHRN